MASSTGLGGSLRRPGPGASGGRKNGQHAALLLGPRTYEDFYGFSPNQIDNPFTEMLTNIRKYVASKTMKEPLP